MDKDNILIRYMLVPYNRKSMKAVRISPRERYLHGFNIPDRFRPMNDKPQFIDALGINRLRKDLADELGVEADPITFSEPIPNILQERLTAFLDSKHSEILEWLDNNDALLSTEYKQHKIYQLPVYIKANPSISWRKQDSPLPALTRQYQEKALRFILHRATIKCDSGLGEYGGSSAWSYIAVSDYGHLIPGRIRYVENIT